MESNEKRPLHFVRTASNDKKTMSLSFSFQRECKHNETQPCKNKNKDSKQNLSLFLSSLEIFKKAMKQTHLLLAALHCL